MGLEKAALHGYVLHLTSQHMLRRGRTEDGMISIVRESGSQERDQGSIHTRRIYVLDTAKTLLSTVLAKLHSALLRARAE